MELMKACNVNNRVKKNLLELRAKASNVVVVVPEVTDAEACKIHEK
jgi:hypothetical protein